MGINPAHSTPPCRYISFRVHRLEKPSFPTNPNDNELIPGMYLCDGHNVKPKGVVVSKQQQQLIETGNHQRLSNGRCPPPAMTVRVSVARVSGAWVSGVWVSAPLAYLARPLPKNPTRSNEKRYVHTAHCRLKVRVMVRVRDKGMKVKLRTCRSPQTALQ
jgi:hypothetical protein